MNSQNQRKTTQKLINDFCQNLEKIDFSLNELIKYGYILHGQTKSGITTTGHLLNGNELKGIKIGSKEKLENATSKYRSAKIGNTFISQTRVPNLFGVKHPNDPQEKVHVIDTPGFGSTLGIFGLLSSGYCRYKLYSKVQNMKFVLCFDSIQLQNTAQLFIDTIVQFTSYFKDYENYKEEIWKSCVFLINKVDENLQNLNDSKENLREIKDSIKMQKNESQIRLIKQFIGYVIENGRVFTIKKYRPGESATRFDLLKDIDLKTSWWSRSLNPKNEQEIDMQPIRFNIIKPILVEIERNELSKEEFIKLINYYDDRINEITNQWKQEMSLKSVLDYLTKDAMGPPDSHDFLIPMRRYVDKYYHIYDQNYRWKREKMEKEMFEIDKQRLSVTKWNETNGMNFLVKFQVLQRVEKIKCDINTECCFGQLSVEQKNQTIRKGILEIIKQFNKLGCRRKQWEETICKYGYIINRVISEVQMLLLVYKCGETSNRYSVGNKLCNATQGHYLSFQRLSLFMGLCYWYQDGGFAFQNLKYKFISDFDLNNEWFQKVTLNWELVDFFLQFDSCQHQESQYYYENHKDPCVAYQKIIKVLARFSDQFLSNLQSPENYGDTIKLIQRLTSARINCEQLICIAQDQDRKCELIFLLRRVTKNLGKLLQNIKKWHLARQVYNSIMYVRSVCRLYEKQIQSLNDSAKLQINNEIRNYKNESTKLRIQYDTYLRYHGCGKQNIISLQQAFELASSKKELQEVTIKLCDAFISGQSIEELSDVYLPSLWGRQFFETFSDDLVKNIQSLS